MSKRYKGAVISATPPTTSTSSASGVWTEQQFMQGVASGSWPALAGAPTIGTATAGALNASVAFTAPTYTGSGITGYTATSSPGGITGTGASSPITVSGLTAGTAYTFTVTATTAAGQSSASAASNSVTPTPPVYIEDIYSTYLYTGNGSTQTITNGIDLSTKGGLVWTKYRNDGYWHTWFDTVRGNTKVIYSNSTSAQDTLTNAITSFTSTGYTLGADTNGGNNTSGGSFVSWTFREQPKFFDVLTYTGDGAVSRNISHNLGSEVGSIFLKRTSGAASSWSVYHRSLGTGKFLQLNTTGAVLTDADTFASVTSTTFSVSSNTNQNDNGESYVAYLFAHDAGGFGLTGTDNVISCGSFTTNGSGQATVDLGYEPQFLIHKATTGSESWLMLDTMRGWNMSTADRDLFCNSASAEASGNYGDPTSTGFTAAGLSATRTYIYIAIRRGPMKVPTSGTSVFSPFVGSDTSTITTGFPVDMLFDNKRAGNSNNTVNASRLVGENALITSSTAAETAGLTSATWFQNNTGYLPNALGTGIVAYAYRRAPSFFDEVCYTGTGSLGNTLTHNLGVTPELMIVKCRSNNPTNWTVYTATTGNTAALYLNDSASVYSGDINYWNDTSPTATQFTVGLYGTVNGSGRTYVAYLFATCAGVSKVGSYTGNGSTQTIDCGFGAGGARFVLIKRTDSTGDWYVYDTARGMTVLTDPYLLLNSTAAEVATLGSVTTVSTGFALNATILAAINTNAASYIFLAIA